MSNKINRQLSSLTRFQFTNRYRRLHRLTKFSIELLLSETVSSFKPNANVILCIIGGSLLPSRIGTLIAGRYIDEVLKEEFFSSAPAGVLEKRVFWDNRIVSDSLPGLSGLADKEEKEMQQAEEKASEQVRSKEGGKRG